MKKKTDLIELSDDVKIDAYVGGVKLVKQTDYHSNVNIQHSISELFGLPCNVYFLDMNSNVVAINETFLNIYNFASEKDVLNKTALNFVEKNAALAMLNEDMKTLSYEKLQLFDSNASLLSGLECQYLTIKTPWLNENNKIIGVCGSSIVLGSQPLSSVLSKLGEFGLLPYKYSVTLSASTRSGNYLSRRETECLRLIVSGMTAKEIGKSLGLSYRTIEQYIDNLKVKFSVASKAELIQKALQQGYF